MQISLRLMVLIFIGFILVACGSGSSGGTGGSTNQVSNSTPIILTAGTTYTLPANTSVLVPSGTVVTSTNKNTININGTDDTINTPAGSVINVPATSVGAATNTVTDISASGNISNATLSVTALAGSATTIGVPVDGTGAAAVFWGRGHLAVNSSGDIIVTDRGGLRQVTPAGVVTTLLPLSQSFTWDGIAIDSNGNVFGSGNFYDVSNNQTIFSGSVNEFTATGTNINYLYGWITTISSPAAGEIGFGGMAIDKSGNLFLASVYSNQIIKFPAVGGWTVLAGSGAVGNSDGTGTAATFNLNFASEIAIDSNSNLYINSNGTIRKITSTGVVTTLVSVVNSNSGAIAVDNNNNIYVPGFETIYRISASGTVTAFDFPNTADTITTLNTDAKGNLYAGAWGLGAQIFKISF